MIKHHMNVLGDLHTVHRYMKRDVGKLPQSAAVKPGQPNHLVPALSGVLYRVEHILRVPAAGNSHHQIPQLQMPSQLKPKHLLKPNVIGYRHHRGHVIVETKEIELLPGMLRNAFIKIVLEM